MPLIAERRTRESRKTCSPRIKQRKSNNTPAILNRNAPNKKVGNPCKATPIK